MCMDGGECEKVMGVNLIVAEGLTLDVTNAVMFKSTSMGVACGEDPRVCFFSHY